MFGNKIKLSMTHDEIRVLVYALNELRNALTGPEPARTLHSHERRLHQVVTKRHLFTWMVPHYIAKK